MIVLSFEHRDPLNLELLIPGQASAFQILIVNELLAASFEREGIGDLVALARTHSDLVYTYLPAYLDVEPLQRNLSSLVREPVQIFLQNRLRYLVEVVLVPF